MIESMGEWVLKAILGLFGIGWDFQAFWNDLSGEVKFAVVFAGAVALLFLLLFIIGRIDARREAKKQEKAEPISGYMPAVRVPDAKAQEERDALRKREGVIPIEWVLQEIYEFCEEQERERGEA